MEEAKTEDTVQESPPTANTLSHFNHPTSAVDALLEPNNEIKTMDGSSGAIVQEQHSALLPVHVPDCSSEETSEVVSRMEGTEEASLIEARGIGTSSVEDACIDNIGTTLLESGASVISSLDEPDDVAQVDDCKVEVAEVGERSSPDSVGFSSEKSRHSDGSEAGASLNIEPFPTSDSIVSTSHEITDVKIKNANGLEDAPTTIEHAQTINVNNIDVKKGSQEGKPQPKFSSHSSIRQQKSSYLLISKSPAILNSEMTAKQAKAYSGLVDTAAPFESVKEAVSKFGGIVDWKAHKAQTLKRREFVNLELRKAQEEVPVYKKQMEEAEDAKEKVLNELQDTKRLIEELKLDLERVQTEEAQAKQDAELVELRVKEMEQGIAGDASIAIKTQVDVAKRRHVAAIEELESVRTKMKLLQEEHAILLIERENAIKRANDAVSASSNIEKTVEDLTLELITAREALEAAHAAHMEAEEHRIGAALARDQDSLTWEKELKQAEDELKQLNEKLSSMKVLQTKLDTASVLLLNLKAELAAYMESKLNEESQGIIEAEIKSDLKDGVKTHADVQEKIASLKKEMEEVKTNIEKAKMEVEILKIAAVSLKSELKKEKASLSYMQQREGMASIAVSSLEAEVKRTREEIEIIQAKEREAKDQMLELPKALQKAARDAEEAKSAAQSAQEELRKAMEEEEQIKASMSTLQSRLNAALKEIDAAKVSEKLALAAVKALQESEQAGCNGDANNWVTLPLDEYYVLSKRAHEAEEEANERVTAAISQIELAKISESNCLHDLEDALQKLSEKKEALRLATEKAEVAKQGKLAVEQELRKWRADRKKANDASHAVVTPSGGPQRNFDEVKSFVVTEETVDLTHTLPTRVYSPESNTEVKVKKKRSLIPKIVMILGRKKTTK